MSINQSYKTFYNIQRIVFWADQEGFGEDGQKRPRMTLSYRDGNPRFTVYTGASVGMDGMINFPMDTITFGSVIELFKTVIEEEPGSKRSIDSFTKEYVDNKPTENLKLMSTLHMGKTKDGIVYLSLIEEGKPKIVFPLRHSKWHSYRDANKEELSVADVSLNIARGVANMFENILSHVIMQYNTDEYTYGGRPPMPLRGYENLKAGSTSTPVTPSFSKHAEEVSLPDEMKDMLADIGI